MGSSAPVPRCHRPGRHRHARGHPRPALPTRGARDRSLFGLYQVIGQGLEGTAMTSFASLSPEDRWALAFYAGTFAYPAGLAEQGERIWNAEPAVRARIPNLGALVALTPAALARDLGEDKAAAVIAYLAPSGCVRGQ